tara:strand:- start:3935 stop:4162 length:228 start_codon:yes stop_codon:yes gene_type:complete
MKVENKNAHRAADKEYYFATHIKNNDGEVQMLLLTDKEYERAVKRAERNKEDLPSDYSVVHPKKERGIFDWLFGG